MLNLKIQTDNAAFEDNPAGECARLLRVAADLLEDCYDEGALRDINGNIVGEFRLKR